MEEEENQVNQRGVINTKQDLFKNLLFEAHSQTGSLADMFSVVPDTTTTDPDPIDPLIPPIPPEFFLFGKKWRPTGRITIHDDLITNSTGAFSTEVPLQGAKVVMRNRIYRVAKAITDDEGRFEANRSVRGKIRYVLKWERSPWSIRRGTFGQAETKGPRVKNQPWIYHIRGGEPEYFGTIHRALHNYYLRLRSEIKNLVQTSWLGLFQKSLQTCGNHFFCKTHYASQEACF